MYRNPWFIYILRQERDQICLLCDFVGHLECIDKRRNVFHCFYAQGINLSKRKRLIIVFQKFLQILSEIEKTTGNIFNIWGQIL